MFWSRCEAISQRETELLFTDPHDQTEVWPRQVSKLITRLTAFIPGHAGTWCNKTDNQFVRVIQPSDGSHVRSRMWEADREKPPQSPD